MTSEMRKPSPSDQNLEPSGEADQRRLSENNVSGAARRLPQWVKLRRTQPEQMSSGLPLKADIAQYGRHVSNVPHPDIPLNQWRGACFDSLSASRRTVFANVTPCTKPAANDDHRLIVISLPEHNAKSLSPSSGSQ
jgi:hypothetical protein